MYTDCHVHTDFSSDSHTFMVNQIKKAIDLGMKQICITDHQDFDFPFEVCNMSFQFDTTDYFKSLRRYKEEFKDQIDLLFGVELGMLDHLPPRIACYTKEWDFDYVIGSVHLVHMEDPYYPEFFEGRSVEAAIMDYFQAVLTNITSHGDYVDALGHLDYVVRYIPDGVGDHYPNPCFQEIIDEILRVIIDKNVALECNTAGLRKGQSFPNPHKDVIRRYAELGGRMVTLGSDAHVTEDLGYAFTSIGDYLKDCGITHQTVFIKREPVFVPL